MSFPLLSSLSNIRLPFSPSTPPLQPAPRPPSTTPSDDDSIIDELSFEYTVDQDGNAIRLNKGASKSNTSSPPTPPESAEFGLLDRNSPPPPQSIKKLPSPTLTNLSAAPRISLTRSESAYSVLTIATPSERSSAQGSNPTARSFKRVASGPLSTTQGGLVPSSSYANSHPPSSSTAKPRRITLEEYREQEARSRRQVEELRLRMEEEARSQAEKENLMNGRQSVLDERGYGSSAAIAIPSKRNSPPLSSRTIQTSQRVQSALQARAAAYASSANLSRPLAEVPVPQRVSRPTRLGKYGSVHNTGFDRIPESDSIESEYGTDYHTGEETDTGGDDPELNIPNGTARQRSYGGFASSLTKSGNTRPRRSASLSEAPTQEGRTSPRQNVQHVVQSQYMRPVSSLGLNARRVTIEEKERQDMEMREEYRRYQRASEDLNRDSLHYLKEVQHDSRVPGRSKVQLDLPSYNEFQDQVPQHEPRKSPSPTQNAHLRPPYSHKRKDSDTMRSTALPPSASPTTVEAVPAYLSPSARNYHSSASSSTLASARHRRSPTAPDPPTTSDMLGPHGHSGTNPRITWGGGESTADENVFGNGGMEQGRSVAIRDHSPTQSVALQQQQQQQQRAAPNARMTSSVSVAPAPAPALDIRNRQIIVNRKAYARLDVIGKGGSSRVYRVLNNSNELYAIKRVSLDKTDSETMSGYMNEIALLKRLDGNSRIIRLIDSEVKAGPGGSKGHLLLVMECGEIDFSRLMQEQQREPTDMIWIAYYWQQMLQAVHVIHEEKIVHSDLKPANFVLVRGQLKLIDFGIANAIANDTTNIQRDHQIGTVNYMSPEAIELPEGMRRLKVGRPSDVWSLGCILYQMIYGHPPFQHLSVFQKMKAIPDLGHNIAFPEYATPSIPAQRNSQSNSSSPPMKLDHLKRRVRRDVIESTKSCLCRNPKERATIPELLSHDWLAMKEPELPPKPESPGPKPSPPPQPPSLPKTTEPPTAIEVKDYLDPDETVINTFYMKQLLLYGIKLGQAHGSQITDVQLIEESERLITELKRL